METFIRKGKAWVILDSAGKPINDIDTDMIYHNAHLHVTDIKQMGKHTFGNLKGWEDFAAKKARPGDIVVVGRNFGAGSSRQQAVDCFVSLGVEAIVGESFGAIYRRNAINQGFPILECEGICSLGSVRTGDELSVDLSTGLVHNVTQGKDIPRGKPASKVQLDILKAGGLWNLRR